MPVYEFYCPDCHTIYNFFSRRVDTGTRPACPTCGRPDLARRASLFAISKGREGSAENPDLPSGMDEDRMMKALESMAGEIENVDEENPRQAAKMMRRLFDAAGMKLGDGMAEAIRRMEAGEDPDQIEAEMGDVLEQENPFAGSPVKSSLPHLNELRRELFPPRRDEAWYPLRPRPGDA